MVDAGGCVVLKVCGHQPEGDGCTPEITGAGGDPYYNGTSNSSPGYCYWYLPGSFKHLN